METPPPLTEVDVATRIEILLHEYDNVAEQVLHRYDAQFQAIGAYGAVLVGLLALVFTVKFRWEIVGLVALSTFIFVGVMLWITADITRQGKWLRGLESEINRQAGAPLLRWELTRGFFGATNEDSALPPRTK